MEDCTPAKRASRKKRSLATNIFTGLQQMNAPLILLSLQDALTSKLNQINSDAAASNRLFTTILPTKQSRLQLSNEKFIDLDTPEFIEVHLNRLNF